MLRYLKTFLDMKDENFLKTHTQKCWELEMPCTTDAKHRSADYVYQLLVDNGFQAERLNMPADGKTVFHDEFAPVCWDAKVGRLTVVSEWEGDPVVADFERHPFHLIQYSTSAPEGGEDSNDFIKRLALGLNEIVRDMMNEGVTNSAVIMHGGAIMMLLAACAVPRKRSIEWTSEPGGGYSLLITPSLYHSSGIVEVFDVI